MIHDVKEYFGLEREFRNAAFMETDSYRQIFNDVVSTIKDGYLVALTGIVGCGKTVTARRIRQELKKRNEIIVSTTLTVEKNRVKVGTLMYALFADLMTDKKAPIPSKLEFRERELIRLISSKKKPVVLFIDEAHDLHHKTLISLKRLQEVGKEANSLLSIVMVGHPKLSIDLNLPSMEEVGGRVVHMSMDGIRGIEAHYIDWILKQCLNKKAKSTDVFTKDALELMAKKFTTPLQINHYAWKAFVKAYQVGQKPVSVDILDEVIARDLNGIEANLKRHGYDIKALSDTLDAKPAEIRSFFKGHLSSGRSQEMEGEILKPGLMGS